MPLKPVSLHVRCDRCAGRFGIDVLDEEEARQYLNLAPLRQAPWSPAPALESLAPLDVYEEFGGESVALLRGVVVEVLRRADDVTVAGLAAGVRLARREGALGYGVENLRHDIGHLDVTYLRSLIRERVVASRIQREQARDLVSLATQIAHANGHLAPEQWDWIVSIGLDAGIGPTASREVRSAIVG